MAFVTIAGVDVNVMDDDQAQRLAPQKVGKSGRTFNGALRSTQRLSKRVWQFTTVYMTEAAITTLMTAAADGAFVTCTGLALGGVNVTCEVNYNPQKFIIDSLSYLRSIQFTLVEV